MLSISDDENNDYLFATSEINWEIENFYFAYPLNNCTIFSSVFALQGLQSVKWRLSLELEDKKSPEITDIEMSAEKSGAEMSAEKSGAEMSAEKSGDEMSAEKSGDEMSDEKSGAELSAEKDGIKSSKNGVVSVYLEMLPSSLAKHVCVNWEMTLTVGTAKIGPYERKDDFGERSKHGHIGIATTQKILDLVLLSKHEKICIRFYFLAFDKGKFWIPTDQKTLGILNLCKELKHFKDLEENFSDIKLKVKNEYIKAHKIVLSCNERFEIYMMLAVNDEVEIPGFDYKTLDAFVNFLYTQEVSYCLENLSISMIRCMEHFNCNPLKPYYIPEELSMNSKIKIMKHEFQWYVPDILDKDDFAIRSPPIIFLGSNNTWYVTISMEADDPNKFISIYATIESGDKPKYLSLEFGLINETGKECFSRRLIRNNECYENLGFDQFVKKEEICANRCVTMGDCVNFLFRLRTSNGFQETSKGCQTMSFILPNKSKHYKQMYKKMLDFYKKETYSDVTIISNRDINKANKFILAARSPGFMQMIENNGNTITAWGIEPYLLRIILKYMYTGVLDQKGEVILELSKISTPEKLNIPSLHAECQQYLKERNACYNVKRKF